MFTDKKLSRLKCCFLFIGSFLLPRCVFFVQAVRMEAVKPALCMGLRFGMFARVLLICQFFVRVFVSYLSVI